MTIRTMMTNNKYSTVEQHDVLILLQGTSISKFGNHIIYHQYSDINDNYDVHVDNDNHS